MRNRLRVLRAEHNLTQADLAEKLGQVIGDPALAESLRRRAVERAAREYDWDRVAAQHRAVYARVVA